MKLVIQLVVGIYLGLAPIYWLPGISAESLGNIKIALFIFSVAVISVSALLGNKMRLPRGILGPIGLALTLLSTAGGLMQSESSLIFSTLKDYLLVFSALWITFILLQIKINIEQTLTLSAAMIASACAVVAASKYVDGLDFHGPAQFRAEHLWISGFGSLRTGWSNGVALYVAPLALAFGRKNTGLWIALKVCAAAAIGAIVITQYTVGGRAGLLASLIILGFTFNQQGKRKYLIALSAIAAMLILSNIDSVYTQMRISREEGTQHHKADNLNTISAGRLQGSMIGLEKAMESPLFGNGLQSIIIGHDEIHNLWIRLAAECGFFAPIVLLCIVYKILRAAYATSRANRNRPETRFRLNIYIGGLVAGVFISMLEPRMILGTFQTSIMWWVFAGIVCHGYDSMRHVSIRRNRQTLVPGPHLINE